MIRSALRLSVLAASMLAAHAQATTFSFTGVVDYAWGYNTNVPSAGETVSGSYTLTLPSNANSYSWDSVYRGEYGYGATVSGSAKFSDGTSVSVTSNASSFAEQFVYRNYYGINEIGSYVSSQNAGDYTSTTLEVYASDYNGAASTMFTDPNGGLSFDQGINLSNATGYGYIVGSTATGYFEDEIQLTSMKVSSVSAVPEASNAALLLAGLGFVSLVARKRRAQA